MLSPINQIILIDNNNLYTWLLGPHRNVNTNNSRESIMSCNVGGWMMNTGTKNPLEWAEICLQFTNFILFQLCIRLWILCLFLIWISAGADGGPRSRVLAPGSAHARPSARPPIDTSGNFSAQMSGGGGNCLIVFLINFLAKSENAKHFSFFSKNWKNKKCLELPDLARKLIKKTFWKFYPPPEFLVFFLKKPKIA